MPTVTERLKSVETLVKALAALLALMPGIAVLTGLIDIPPTLVQLVKALSFFVSIVVLIGILLISQRIRRMTGTAVAILALGAVVVGAAGAVGYWSFAGRHIVVVESADGEGEAQTERYLVPMRPSAEIQRLVAPYSGDYAEALLTSNQRARLRQLMDQDSGGTAALMIVLLVLAQTLLVAGVAAGAWKLAMSDEDDQTGKSGAALPPPYSAPASG
jgi:flagellar basal body-associated protein FliL